MAHECGIKFDLHDVAKIFKQDALHRRPQAGRQVRGVDLYEVGGIPMLMKELLDAGLCMATCLTATGKTMAETIRT